VARVSTEDGQRIVGVKIPRSQVRQVLRALGLDGPKADPRQVFDELMQGGEPLTLVSGLSLKASTLNRKEPSKSNATILIAFRSCESWD